MLLELNKEISGEFAPDTEIEKKLVCATVEDMDNLLKLLAISEDYLSNFRNTENASQFYDSVPLIKSMVPSDIREESFYAVKNNFVYENIPSKLVYILRKSMQVNVTPNRTIAGIDSRILGKYLKPGVLQDGITVLTVLENIFGQSIELLRDYRLKVKFKDIYEVYISNADVVCIVPEDIAINLESIKDLESLVYSKEVGVTLYDEPLRGFGGRVGITFDDFDLTGAI